MECTLFSSQLLSSKAYALLTFPRIYFIHSLAKSLSARYLWKHESFFKEKLIIILDCRNINH